MGGASSIAPDRCNDRKRASWNQSYEGFVEPGKRRLTDTVFRLAAIADPDFRPAHQTRLIAQREETDYMGASFEEKVYRLGDARGLEITDRVNDPNDGMTPYSAWTGIVVYGLPASYRLSLSSQCDPPGADSVTLTAQVPKSAARQIGELLKQEFEAIVWD